MAQMLAQAGSTPFDENWWFPLLVIIVLLVVMLLIGAAIRGGKAWK